MKCIYIYISSLLLLLLLCCPFPVTFFTAVRAAEVCGTVDDATDDPCAGDGARVEATGDGTGGGGPEGVASS